MPALWSEIREDIRFRHGLMYPRGSGPLGWLRASVFSRGTLVLAVHRISRQAMFAKDAGLRSGRPLGWVAAIGRRLVMIVAKAHVERTTDIAPGVCFPDEGHLVLGPLEIGPGTVLQPRVTIGMGVVDGGRPRIGARVWVGADSILYGAILVGDGATVMPGSVVSRHVPPGAVVSGNPPRLLALDYDNAVWRAAHWNGGPVERFPEPA